MLTITSILLPFTSTWPDAHYALVIQVVVQMHVKWCENLCLHHPASSNALTRCNHAFGKKFKSLSLHTANPSGFNQVQFIVIGISTVRYWYNTNFVPSHIAGT